MSRTQDASTPNVEITGNDEEINDEDMVCPI